MNSFPCLSFLSPDKTETAMVVDEIDFGHEKECPIAPFKGSKFTVSPGQTSPLDVHDVKECWFVAAGHGIVTYSGVQKEVVNAGDVLYFEPQRSHEVYNNGTENLLIFSIWWN